MTKKELQTLVKSAVKEVIKEEMKPMIQEAVRKSIKKEFYLMLEEVEESKNVEKDYSLTNMVRNESDPIREQVQQKFFDGNDPISSVLNQTAQDVATGRVNMSGHQVMSNASPIVNNQPAQPVHNQSMQGKSYQVNNQPAQPMVQQEMVQGDRGLPLDAIPGLNKDYRAILQKADKVANQMYRGNVPTRRVKAPLQKFEQNVEDTYANQYKE